VRKRARESGIALSQVTGTGPGGRIVKKDLESFLSAVSVPATSPAAIPAPTTAVVGSAGYTDRPHTGMRRAVARRLTESKTTVPHFYVTADCRMERLLEARAQKLEALRSGLRTQFSGNLDAAKRDFRDRLRGK
jgi:pyruvate dehydrogenase E2 component (dihydrolipoamide acetyltransferase)